MFLLATRNPGKIAEIRHALRGLGLQFVSAAEWGEFPEPEEAGSSFVENARLKAEYYFNHTGLESLADDSGLCVDALHGAPGIHSARFAGTDSERIGKLLGLLAHLDPSREEHSRTARFVCAMCLFGKSRILEVEGVVEGVIAAEPLGTGGFGYDPIFLYPPLGRTFAQLSKAEKNQVSHRALALQKLKVELQGSHA